MIPDGEQVAKAWAKGNAAIFAIAGDRVSARLPSNMGQSGTFPWLRVFVVPGQVPDPTGAYGVFMLQWDAFAEGPGDDRGAPNMRSASKLARTVESEILALGELRAFPITIEGGEQTAIVSAQVTVGPHRLPEPTTGWARVRMDSIFSVRASATV